MNIVLNRVRSLLATTSPRWRELADKLPVESFAETPAAGEWSALDCLLHLIDTERLFQSRLNAFRESRDFPAFDPDTQGTRPGGASAAELAETFAQLREESLTMLDLITPANLNVQVRHAELGPVTLGEMLNEWAAHDLNHTIQAELALMQPFIRGCGPWRKYFTGQIIER